MANTRTLPTVVVAAAAIVCVSAPRIAESQVRETGLTLEARFGPEFTESFNRTLQVGPSTTLNLTNESGDVVITGGGGTELRIDAVKRVRQMNEPGARMLLQAMVITISEQNGQVEVTDRVPARGGLVRRRRLHRRAARHRQRDPAGDQRRPAYHEPPR